MTQNLDINSDWNFLKNARTLRHEEEFRRKFAAEAFFDTSWRNTLSATNSTSNNLKTFVDLDDNVQQNVCWENNPTQRKLSLSKYVFVCI